MTPDETKKLLERDEPSKELEKEIERLTELVETWKEGHAEQAKEIERLNTLIDGQPVKVKPHEWDDEGEDPKPIY